MSIPSLLQLLLKRMKVPALLLLMGVEVLVGGDVEISASVDRGKVEVGETFIYSVEVRVKGVGGVAPDVRLPSFEGFEVKRAWQETHIIIAHEPITEYVEKVELEAGKEGKFVIEPAEVKVGSKVYKTGSVKVEVVSPSQQSGRKRVGTSSLYLEWEVDKRELFVNERAVMSIELFSKYPLWARPRVGIAKDSLFTKMELLSCYKEPYQGMEKWKIQIAFYPKRTGKVRLGPVEVRVPLGIFEEAPLTIGAFEMMVKELPQRGRPDDFEGAVGEFRARMEADVDSVNVGEAVGVKLIVEGTGDLDLIGFKGLALPDGMEGQLWDIEENVFEENGVLWKRRTYVYILYPLRGGIFNIEGIRFSYFNPTEKEYRLCESGKLRIFVGLHGGSLAKVLELH